MSYMNAVRALRLSKYRLPASLLLAVTINQMGLSVFADSQKYDWVKKESLPEHLQDQVKPGCNGLYVDPTPANAPQVSGQQDANLIIEADQALVEDGQKATIDGGVIVRQDDKSISAENMSYDRSTDIAILDGGVTIRQPGLLIEGNSASVEFQNDKSRFDDARFVFHEQHMRGSAESVKQVSNSTVELHNGSFTTCEPGSTTWKMEGEKISINRETSQGYGKNVKLKIGEVPVLYLPYISFPVGDERQSGFLFPAISNDEDGGLDIAIPYYWNIAPNYDATITPRIISSRGLMLETEARHLNQWVRTTATGAFLPNDGGSRDTDLRDLINNGDVTEEEAEPRKGKNRWLIGLQQKSDATRGWYIDNDYTRVSDINYFRDLGSSSFAAENTDQLNQIFSLGYRSTNWDSRILTEQHQLLLRGIDNSYKKIPQISVNGFYHYGGANTLLSHEYTLFRSDQEGIIEANRFNLDYRINWDKRAPWGFFKPEIGYQLLHYDLDVNEEIGFTDDPTRKHDTLMASVDTGLIFERKNDTFTQTFEPRVFYLYRQFEDQSDLFDVIGEQDLNFDSFARTFSYHRLFADSRYIGGDRLDDTRQITLGASSSIYNNKTGEERARLSFGKIYYFDDRQVFLSDTNEEEANRLNSSEIALETAIQFTEHRELILTGVYDTQNKRTTRSSARFHYSTEDYGQIYNAAYTQARGDQIDSPSEEFIEQIDLSTSIQIKPQWATMARVNYDLRNEQELETFIGLEYDDCCYRFRFLIRKWLDSNIAIFTDEKSSQTDTGVFFEIHLKGLGGSGAKLNSILNDGIFGYRDRTRFRQ